MRLNFVLLLLAVSAIGTTGCYAHVALPPVPSRDADLQERTAAYDDLAPEAMSRTTTVTVNRGVPFATSRTDFLMLRNGLRVYHPEDLLPAVDPSSPTAEYIRSYTTRETYGNVVGGVGTGAGVVGLAAMGYALYEITERHQESNVAVGVAIAGGTAMFVSLGVTMVLNLMLEADKASAFMSYDRSLQKRLGLHANGASPATTSAK